jgi:hypothetical protein
MQLASISLQDLSVLKNHEIIAINQDPMVGTSISPFRWGINVCPVLIVLHRLRMTKRLIFRAIGCLISPTLHNIGVE